MKQSTIWGFHRAGIICLNTYLIFSLNFVAIFAHGSPDRISDNIHSSNRQRYRDRHHNYSNKGGSDPVSLIGKGTFTKQYIFTFYLDSMLLENNCV